MWDSTLQLNSCWSLQPHSSNMILKAKVRRKGNTAAHSSHGSVFVYYRFLENKEELLSASAWRHLDRKLKFCVHINLWQPLAMWAYFPLPISFSKDSRESAGQQLPLHTNALQMKFIYSPPQTEALAVSPSLNLFCFFWLLSLTLLFSSPFPLSALCLLTCSPSPYPPLPLLLLFSCDSLSVAHWEWI